MKPHLSKKKKKLVKLLFAFIFTWKYKLFQGVICKAIWLRSLWSAAQYHPWNVWFWLLDFVWLHFSMFASSYFIVSTNWEVLILWRALLVFDLVAYDLLPNINSHHLLVIHRTCLTHIFGLGLWLIIPTSSERVWA